MFDNHRFYSFCFRRILYQIYVVKCFQFVQNFSWGAAKLQEPVSKHIGATSGLQKRQTRSVFSRVLGKLGPLWFFSANLASANWAPANWAPGAANRAPANLAPANQVPANWAPGKCWCSKVGLKMFGAQSHKYSYTTKVKHTYSVSVGRIYSIQINTLENVLMLNLFCCDWICRA